MESIRLGPQTDISASMSWWELRSITDAVGALLGEFACGRDWPAASIRAGELKRVLREYCQVRKRARFKVNTNVDDV